MPYQCIIDQLKNRLVLSALWGVPKKTATAFYYFVRVLVSNFLCLYVLLVSEVCIAAGIETNIYFFLLRSIISGVDKHIKMNAARVFYCRMRGTPQI